MLLNIKPYLLFNLSVQNISSKIFGINNENVLRAKPEMIIPIPARIREYEAPPSSPEITDINSTNMPLVIAGKRRTANREKPRIFCISQTIQPIIGGTVA
jgi:hypothetical protein